MKLRYLLAPVVALSLVACGDDKSTNPGTDTATATDTAAQTDTQVASDVATQDTAEPGPDTTLPPGCDEYGWVAEGGTGAISAADNAGELASTSLVSFSSKDVTNYDFLNLELLYVQGFPFETGTFSFSTAKLEDCNLCLRLYTGCNDEADLCESTFLAQAGSVEVTTNEGASGKFVGTMRGVKMAEVTVNEETLESVIVPNGRVWCIDGYAFDVNVIPK